MLIASIHGMLETLQKMFKMVILHYIFVSDMGLSLTFGSYFLYNLVIVIFNNMQIITAFGLYLLNTRIVFSLLLERSVVNFLRINRCCFYPFLFFFWW